MRRKIFSQKCAEKTVREYAASSSAHGISYIFEENRVGLERVFWVVVVGLGLVLR
jgi:hypothetical protein